MPLKFHSLKLKHSHKICDKTNFIFWHTQWLYSQVEKNLHCYQDSAHNLSFIFSFLCSVLSAHKSTQLVNCESSTHANKNLVVYPSLSLDVIGIPWSLFIFALQLFIQILLAIQWTISRIFVPIDLYPLRFRGWIATDLWIYNSNSIIAHGEVNVNASTSHNWKCIRSRYDVSNVHL